MSDFPTKPAIITADEFLYPTGCGVSERVGLASFCPMTSQVKGYPFEVEVKGTKANGVVLSEQVKSLDWKARRYRVHRKDRVGYLRRSEVQAYVAN